MRMPRNLYLSISIHAANPDISTELLDMLRSKVLEMRDQLSVALVQQPKEITDIKPTSAQLTSMIVTSCY